MSERGTEARVSIVDDQESNVRLLERILARGGFASVKTFTDGGAMLDAIASDSPDLLLLDLHLPAPDGFAIIETIRSGGAGVAHDLPILVLTADVGHGARARAIAMGANDYLVKPFDADEVIVRARNLAELGLLKRQLRERSPG
ncbi:MAG: response regulator [Chloroflexi bacterium]|nr:response regulator [Chloroflexota bacterium]